jgi:hypothetical protein
VPEVRQGEAGSARASVRLEAEAGTLLVSLVVHVQRMQADIQRERCEGFACGRVRAASLKARSAGLDEASRDQADRDDHRPRRVDLE